MKAAKCPNCGASIVVDETKEARKRRKREKSK